MKQIEVRKTIDARGRERFVVYVGDKAVANFATQEAADKNVARRNARRQGVAS